MWRWILNTTETFVDDKKVTCEKNDALFTGNLIGNYMLIIISCHFY